MIKHFEDRVKLVFGTGDIGFNAGVFDDDRAIGPVGILIFYNQEARNIGEVADIKAGTTVAFEDFPVVMQFNKVESIDVLIEALNEAKQAMTKCMDQK